MIGLGMVVCGSCPGTVFVQVSVIRPQIFRCSSLFFSISSGSGILNSLLTCLGGILGTFFYYIFVHARISKEKVPTTAIVQRRLSDILHVPSIILHAAFGLILLGVAIGLEFAVPWKKDLNSRLITTGSVDPEQTPGHIFGMAAWPPTICGAGVGLLQFFFILLLEKSLGVSSAFTVFSAQICRIKPIGRALPSLNAFTYGLKNYVALLFAVGAIGGSCLSSGTSRTLPLGAENGTNALNSVLGGFLLLLGARCAGGCTSGQGISGKRVQLCMHSLVLCCCRYITSVDRFIYCHDCNIWCWYSIWICSFIE